MARLSRFGVAAITAVAIIPLLTYGANTIGLWAGGYPRDFIVKSFVLLPILLGLSAALWPSQKLKPSALVAGIAGATIGLAYGYLAPRVMVGIVSGRWQAWERSVFLTVSWSLDVEAVVCATVAGASALLLALTSRNRAVVLAVVILVTIGVAAPAPAFNLLTHNQQLTLAVVIPQGSVPTPDLPVVEERRDVPPIDVSSVTNRVMQSLRDAGIAGTYQVASLCRQGQGKQVLTIIVITGPVAERADLPEPSGTDVIYLQDRGGFKTIPAHVRTLDRPIRIYPPLPGDDELGVILAEEATGALTFLRVPRPVP